MRLFFYILSIILFVFISSMLIIFAYRADIAANILSKKLQTPVSIRSIKISKNGLSFKQFDVANLPPAKTIYALQVGELNINTTLSGVLQKVSTYESILFNNILINIELYNVKGSQNNWQRIMDKPEPAAKSGKKYLIKTLALNNISIHLVMNNGQTKHFMIQNMEFHNITEESGFPIEEIEKAIIDAIIRQIMQNFNLPDILSPRQIIPKLIKFPLIGEKEECM